MPVGKESIKRAASAGKKPSTKKTTAKAKTEAVEVTESVIAATDEQVKEKIVEKVENKPIGIKDELPVYLL